MRRCAMIMVSAILLATWYWANPAFGNGGPFVVKYPGGDPAAKGIAARFDPDLKPGSEERLRVVQEDLRILFATEPFKANETPLATVSAKYTIQNPTSERIEVDFGFPILRGIYRHPASMMAIPDVQVTMDVQVMPEGGTSGRSGPERLYPNVISNSMIYGFIRQAARQTIEKAIADDARMAELVATVRTTGMVRQRARAAVATATQGDAALSKTIATDVLLAKLVAPVSALREPDHEAARAALAKYLLQTKRWSDADTALMVEYTSCDLGDSDSRVQHQDPWMGAGYRLVAANLGPLQAIGEQKATQLLSRLATCCDPKTTMTYESVFNAWGGDVRERSVDLKTGEIRPREITLAPGDVNSEANTGPGGPETADPTVYARVDYLDPKAKITEAEKASCQTVLKNLPVIFTFAPMNLVHYRASFPANSTRTLTVQYKQYAYKDTSGPTSYQLAYVLHPASFWKDFGPIRLEVAVPPGVPIRASIPCPIAGTEEVDPAYPYTPGRDANAPKIRCDIYRTTLTDKTGELFVGMDAAAWANPSKQKSQPKQVQQQSAN